MKNIRVGNQVGNPLIETIQVLNGSLKHIRYHNYRFNNARKELFRATAELNLENEIVVPEDLAEGIFKCRITYSKGIESVEFERYLPRRIRSLKLIECNDIVYSYKYADRSGINELFSRRERCDDILIVKNGLLTDTSYANVAFRKNMRWVTPATPLLCGTARARLLDEKSIHEDRIRMDDLGNFDRIRIFNAMMEVEADLDELVIVP